jgi:hypothetical protein
MSLLERAERFFSQDENPHSFVVNLDKETWRLDQNVTPYLEAAAASREQQWENRHTLRKTHWRPFATIPDIVAIDIMTRYGINIHAPTFGHDKAEIARFHGIIKSEFPHLLLSHGV